MAKEIVSYLQYVAPWTSYPWAITSYPSRSTFFIKMAIPGLFFFIFVFSVQLTVNIQYKFLPMTGFEPRTSGIGSDRSTNWATTTAQDPLTFAFQASGASPKQVDDVEMLAEVKHDLDLGHEGGQVVAIHRRVGHLHGNDLHVVLPDADGLSLEL